MSTLGFEVLVHVVIAAMRTSPDPCRCRPWSSRVGRGPRPSSRNRFRPRARRRSVNLAFRLPRSMRSCGRFGPATQGFIECEVQLDDAGVVDVARLWACPKRPCALIVGLEGRDASRPGRWRGSNSIVLGVDREEAHRRAVFRRHVGDRRAVDDGRAAAPGPKNSTNLPTTFALRSSCVTVSARSVAVTPSRSDAIQPSELTVPERVQKMIPPAPPGFNADMTWIDSNGGTTFDAVTLAGGLATEVIERSARPRASRPRGAHCGT